MDRIIQIDARGYYHEKIKQLNKKISSLNANKWAIEEQMGQIMKDYRACLKALDEKYKERRYFQELLEKEKSICTRNIGLIEYKKPLN